MSNINKEVTLEKLLEEIVQSRKELRSLITSSENRLILELESQNHKILQLERDNKELRERLEILERKNNKKNLVAFGIQRDQDEVTIDSVRYEIKRLMNIDIEECDISDVYVLGKGKDRPVKIELVSFAKKREILSNTKKLEGTNIRITHDLTYKQREEERTLRKHLRQIRETSSAKSYIKGNKLFIDDIPYNLKQLEERDRERESKEGEYGETPLAISTEELGENSMRGDRATDSQTEVNKRQHLGSAGLSIKGPRLRSQK